MAKILRYSDIVVSFNDNSKGLVQNVSVEGDAGLDLVIYSSGAKPVKNNQNINVSIEFLCSGIIDLSQTDFVNAVGKISLANSGQNGSSKLIVNDCLLTEVDYVFSSKDLFTKKLSFIGLSLDNDNTYQAANVTETGRAPFRTWMTSSYYSTTESINVSQKIKRSILYDVGNPEPYISAIELPIETTLTFNVPCSGASYGTLEALSALQGITGCEVSLENNNIIIGICDSNITFTGCYLQNLSYDGGGVDGSPQKATIEFISYNDYGLSNNRIIQYRERPGNGNGGPSPEPE